MGKNNLRDQLSMELLFHLIFVSLRSPVLQKIHENIDFGIYFFNNLYIRFFLRQLHENT